MTGTGECDDRASDDFLVERPEILDRAAAAPGDDDVHARDLADCADRARDVARGALSLHARRTNDEMSVGMPPARGP